MGYYKQLQEFLSQAKTTNLKYSHYKSDFLGTEVRVSFGKGNLAKVPWISFLIEPNKTSHGIYPVYLYYKEFDLLILAYGISETKEPSNKWNISNEKTIEEYFQNNFNTKPHRYGSSFIYRIYNVKDKLDEKYINRDLENIINEYKTTLSSVVSEEDNTIQMKESSLINSFYNSCNESGLVYSPKLIARFIASLATKPFVILTGLSGSGKTKLAQAFAQWICESEKQYCIVPVGADWTNREPLLGYENALERGKYMVPENGALELIIKANNNANKPYFLILDEMNLSHVERYFADFLSVMESKDEIRLHSNTTPLNKGDKIEVNNKYDWPKNLFIIGTVNIDETTYMFSPKVLDRANTIEFRVTQEEIEEYFKIRKEVEMDLLEKQGSPLANKFLILAENEITKKNNIELTNTETTLLSFFNELKKTGAEFGYRTASEMLQLMEQLSVVDKNITENEKLDIAIMQKLLPKLHGSRRKLISTLITLGKFCINLEEITNIEEDVFNKEDFQFNSDGVKYPLSLEKLARMYHGVVQNGFTSYAEA